MAVSELSHPVRRQGDWTSNASLIDTSPKKSLLCSSQMVAGDLGVNQCPALQEASQPCHGMAAGDQRLSPDYCKWAQDSILAVLGVCTSTKTKWREQGSALSGCHCKGLASATTGCTGIVARTNLQASKSNTPKSTVWMKRFEEEGYHVVTDTFSCNTTCSCPMYTQPKIPHCPASFCLIPVCTTAIQQVLCSLY